MYIILGEMCINTDKRKIGDRAYNQSLSNSLFDIKSLKTFCYNYIFCGYFPVYFPVYKRKWIYIMVTDKKKKRHRNFKTDLPTRNSKIIPMNYKIHVFIHTCMSLIIFK